MLTAAQREKCRVLAQALDTGDDATYKRAEPSLTPEMRGEIWDQRAHVKAMAASGDVKTLSRIHVQVSQAAVLRDLDFWSDTDDAPIDDDVPDDEPMCQACKGTGKARDGGVCPICNGAGKLPAEDQPDENEDDDHEDDD